MDMDEFGRKNNVFFVNSIFCMYFRLDRASNPGSSIFNKMPVCGLILHG